MHNTGMRAIAGGDEPLNLVTVIILSYKNTDGVYTTLESVLSQIYPALEIIIADDGTPGFDGEVAPLRRYIDEKKGQNIQNAIILHPRENKGTVKNINGAIRASHGEYVKLIGADDRFTHERVIMDYVSYLVETGLSVCFGKMCAVTARKGTLKIMPK